MKKVLVSGLLAIVIGMSYIGWRTFSQISRATVVDTGTYIIGYENAAGIYHDKSWNVGQLAGYIGTGGPGWNNASLTWTIDTTQHVNTHNIGFDGVKGLSIRDINGAHSLIVGGPVYSNDMIYVSSNTNSIVLSDTSNVRSVKINPTGVVINNAYALPPVDGSVNQLIKTDGSGHLSFTTLNALGFITSYNGTGTQGNGLEVIRANNDATGQTGAISSFTGFSVPALETFEIKGYVNITAVSTDVLNMTVSFTDGNGVTQLLTMAALGGGSGGAAMGAARYYSMMPVTIRARGGTGIIVATTLATGGGSITYDLGATITQLD